MITIRKLEQLPEGTRGRKLLLLLMEAHEPSYDRAIVDLALSLLGEGPSLSVPTDRERALLRYRLCARLGVETADWDLQAPPDRQGVATRFPFNVWLDDVRSPFNVGSIVRTAEAYGFSAVFSSPLSPGIDHPRTRRSAMGAEAHLEFRSLSLEELKLLWEDRPVFALELGGTPLDRFDFPSEGLVLVGGEELGLCPQALAWADASAGRVSLPMYGRKASLNVGVAFGVLAAAWTARRVSLSPEGDSTARA